MNKIRSLSEAPSTEVEVQPQNSSSKNNLENTKLTGITRRNLLSILGVTAVTSAAAFLGCKKPDKNPARESHEHSEANAINLGNVRFFLNQPETISAGQKTELFKNMRNAYEKLKNYLGKEAMVYPEPISVEIVVGKLDKFRGGNTLGRVAFSIEKGTLVNGDIITLEKRQKPLKLILQSIQESNLAHEFIHIYPQGAAMWTEAFFEGHAHAIEKSLYPLKEDDDALHLLFNKEAINKFFDFGLDYHQYDQTLNGGINSSLLSRIVMIKWELEWKKYLGQELDFFKKFYSEVAKQKKDGKTSFSKDDLIAIGRKVSEKFYEWYKNTECFKNIGESKEKTKFIGTIIKDRQLIFITAFNAHPKIIANGRYTPPFLSPMNEGKLQIVTRLGKEIHTLTVETWDKYATINHLPQQYLNDPQMQIHFVK